MTVHELFVYLCVPDASAAIGAEWAKELDSRNLPGTATLNAFRAAVKKTN